jgi:hypothetical protein
MTIETVLDSLMVGDLRIWLYRANPGNPRQMRRRPLSPAIRTPQPPGAAAPSCLAPRDREHLLPYGADAGGDGGRSKVSVGFGSPCGAE